LPAVATHASTQSFADLERPFGPRLGQQNEEFLPAGADHEIVATGVLAQQPCQRHQHGVADGMTEAVVDLLEVVEVHHGQRQRQLPRLQALRQRRPALLELAPVAQAREFIDTRVHFGARGPLGGTCGLQPHLLGFDRGDEELRAPAQLQEQAFVLQRLIALELLEGLLRPAERAGGTPGGVVQAQQRVAGIAPGDRLPGPLQMLPGALGLRGAQAEFAQRHRDAPGLRIEARFAAQPHGGLQLRCGLLEPSQVHQHLAPIAQREDQRVAVTRGTRQLQRLVRVRQCAHHQRLALGGGPAFADEVIGPEEDRRQIVPRRGDGRGVPAFLRLGERIQQQVLGMPGVADAFVHAAQRVDGQRHAGRVARVAGDAVRLMPETHRVLEAPDVGSAEHQQAQGVETPGCGERTLRAHQRQQFQARIDQRPQRAAAVAQAQQGQSGTQAQRRCGSGTARPGLFGQVQALARAVGPLGHLGLLDQRTKRGRIGSFHHGRTRIRRRWIERGGAHGISRPARPRAAPRSVPPRPGAARPRQPPWPAPAAAASGAHATAACWSGPAQPRRAPPPRPRPAAAAAAADRSASRARARRPAWPAR
jgi:hypothetical protein